MCDEQDIMDMRHRVSNAQAEITRLREELLRVNSAGVQLASVLETVEWSWDGSYCPRCGYDELEGHQSLCDIDLALRRAQELGWR